ncbi:MAG: T9SS type A sorting domain-containing protein [Saprospiraceae bacterium]|nr:T9SS type A sorting domain-containing protein [Saprospiraceae bacterium]
MTLIKNLTVALILLSGVRISAQTYSQAQIFGTPKQLAALGIAVDHVHLGASYVEGDFSDYELLAARQSGYEVQVLIADVEEAFTMSTRKTKRSNEACIENLQKFNYETPENFKVGDYGGQLTYDEMEDHLDAMAGKYPDLISQRKPIGNFVTAEGRPIQWLKISDNPNTEESGEPQMLYTALHHAREPISMTQLIFYMWYLLENYAVNDDIKYLINNVEMYFVPCVNPDGYVYNETIRPDGGGRWRKNRRNNGDGTFGVDLNRNYGHQWGHDNVGSSDRTQSEVYRGIAPFSEPETQAIRELVMQHDFKIALNYHSWGGFLIYPFGFDNGPAEDERIFKELANLLTQENRYVYGTGLETVEYTTNGDSDDWMYAGLETKRIFSMTPEIGTEEHGFWPHEDDVEFLCKASLKQNLLAAEFLLNSALLFDESESYITDLQGDLPFKITKLGFEDVAFSVKFTPITSNISFTSNAKIYILNLFGAQQDRLEYTINPDIQDGERIKFAYTIDNGSYILSDTVIKYYRDPRFVLNNLGDLSEWDNASLQSEWGESSNLFVSDPASLTDSPHGNTIPYTTNYLQLDRSLGILNGDSAVLTFKAYWDIQNQFDYLMVEIAADGGEFQPLCGRYSVPGRLTINEGLPIYTGRQLSWIIEEINLSEFVGQEIDLRFAMISTNSDTRDGAYLDDIRILEYNQGSLTGSVDIKPEDIGSFLYPNPGYDRLFIDHDNEKSLSGFSRLEFYNSLGSMVHHQPLNVHGSIDISSWTPGFYYYRLIGPAGRSSIANKLVIKP